MGRCQACGEEPEWLDVLLDLDRLQEATVTRGSHSYTLRTEATGTTASLFKAARLALPPRLTTGRKSSAIQRPPIPWAKSLARVDLPTPWEPCSQITVSPRVLPKTSVTVSGRCVNVLGAPASSVTRTL